MGQIATCGRAARQDLASTSTSITIEEDLGGVWQIDTPSGPVAIGCIHGLISASWSTGEQTALQLHAARQMLKMECRGKECSALWTPGVLHWGNGQIWRKRQSTAQLDEPDPSTGLAPIAASCQIGDDALGQTRLLLGAGVEWDIEEQRPQSALPLSPPATPILLAIQVTMRCYDRRECGCAGGCAADSSIACGKDATIGSDPFSACPNSNRL